MSNTKKMYIGGQWVDAQAGANFDVMNPATGDACHAVADASRADAAKAIELGDQIGTLCPDPPGAFAK